MVNPMIGDYIAVGMALFDEIPAERKKKLKELAAYVQSRIEADETARLTFICTHNSRRSHMAQIWAQTATAYYSVPHVETYSGGTEATAFNPRAVAALQRAGFDITKTSDDPNPVYHVRFNTDAAPMKAFSKTYNDEPNPKDGFCAVMTCADADKNCPLVLGATERFAIPYVDPKAHDNTDSETAAYDERCRQISCEMLYLFSLVNAG
jgi:arsenate reductase